MHLTVKPCHNFKINISLARATFIASDNTRPANSSGTHSFRRPHITNLCQTKSTTWLERSDALNSGPHGCSVGPLRRCEWYAGSRGVVRFRIRTDTKHLFAFTLNFVMRHRLHHLIATAELSSDVPRSVMSLESGKSYASSSASDRHS